MPKKDPLERIADSLDFMELIFIVIAVALISTCGRIPS